MAGPDSIFWVKQRDWDVTPWAIVSYRHVQAYFGGGLKGSRSILEACVRSSEGETMEELQQSQRMCEG